jgi:ribonuclease P protein component
MKRAFAAESAKIEPFKLIPSGGEPTLFEPMERLKRRTDFRAIAQAGARAPAKAFVLQALRRDETGPVRVGFTVSRQVGNAVERNRVRRRLREMVRLKPRAAFTPGYDYVLIGRRTALTSPFSDMTGELDGALRRIATGARNKPPLHRAGSEHGHEPHSTRPRATAQPAKEH